MKMTKKFKINPAVAFLGITKSIIKNAENIERNICEIKSIIGDNEIADKILRQDIATQNYIKKELLWGRSWDDVKKDLELEV